MKTYDFKNVVAETLLIPLYMRAKESRRGDAAILRDSEAERLIQSIRYDYSRFDEAPLSEVGCVVRGWYFDQAVRRFIDKHDYPVVVNVGCGLDTRAQRLGNNPKAVFCELDLPEVISLRRELIPETEHDRYISASLTDTEWMDTLKTNYPDGEFIFVAEGVLMYFYEYQVREFVHRIADRSREASCGSMSAERSCSGAGSNPIRCVDTKPKFVRESATDICPSAGTHGWHSSNRPTT